MLAINSDQGVTGIDETERRMVLKDDGLVLKDDGLVLKDCERLVLTFTFDNLHNFRLNRKLIKPLNIHEVHFEILKIFPRFIGFMV